MEQPEGPGVANQVGNNRLKVKDTSLSLHFPGLLYSWELRLLHFLADNRQNWSGLVWNTNK